MQGALQPANSGCARGVTRLVCEPNAAQFEVLPLLDFVVCALTGRQGRMLQVARDTTKRVWFPSWLQVRPCGACEGALGATAVGTERLCKLQDVRFMCL